MTEKISGTHVRLIDFSVFEANKPARNRESIYSDVVESTVGSLARDYVRAWEASETDEPITSWQGGVAVMIEGESHTAHTSKGGCPVQSAISNYRHKHESDAPKNSFRFAHDGDALIVAQVKYTGFIGVGVDEDAEVVTAAAD